MPFFLIITKRKVKSKGKEMVYLPFWSKTSGHTFMILFFWFLIRCLKPVEPQLNSDRALQGSFGGTLPIEFFLFPEFEPKTSD